MTNYDGKTRFQYATTAGGLSNTTILGVGTASGGVVKKLYITNIHPLSAPNASTLKISCPAYGTAGTPLYVSVSAGYPYPYTFNPAYCFSVVSSTIEQRPIVASCAGANFSFAIMGYVEQE